MRAMIDLFSKRFFLIVFVITSFFSFAVSASVSPAEIALNLKVYAIPVIFVFEYLVGKTKIVKANSTIEMIENTVKKILGISADDLKI